MCSCRSPLRRACPPPPHIKKAFDLKWHKVTRRAPKGHGTWVYDLMGRLVQAEEISAYPGRMRLNLPNGLYTLRLISREGVATTKLLVE